MLGQQGVGAQAEPHEADQNMLHMIQGVMGQVVGVLGGGGGAANPTTIAQFLNTLPDYSYVSGESLVTDLLMTMAEHLTFPDMVAIVAQSPSPATLAGLQAPLQQFLRERVASPPVAPGTELPLPQAEASLLAVAGAAWGSLLPGFS
jgi:hypothetical protein